MAVSVLERLKPHRMTRATEKTTLYLQGFKYIKCGHSSKKISYRCTKYRSGCKATMAFTISEVGYVLGRPHTCVQVPVTNEIRDVTEDMKNYVDSLAISSPSKPARQIWYLVRDEFYTNEAHAVHGLSEQQVISRVYRSRIQHYNQNSYGMIEKPPLSLNKNETAPFFQFHHAASHPETLGKTLRLIGWADPSLVHLLRYCNTTIFIDGTFRCVPRPFKQCVIIMVLDRASGIFVPVFYVLSTSRTADAYWDIIHFVVQSTDQQLCPTQVVCDFEAGLIDAVKTQFPDADIVGCLFHFKQANQRAMRKLSIPPEEIRIAMKPGVLDILCVIKHEDILKHGIKYVITRIKSFCDEDKFNYSSCLWKRYWNYFRCTWINRFPPRVWNVIGIKKNIIARTNNPLERFNREINLRFPTPKPTLVVFVETVKDISDGYVNKISDIKHGKAKRKPRENIDLPTLIEFDSDTDEELLQSEFASLSDRQDNGSNSEGSGDEGSGEEYETNSDVDFGFEYTGE